MFKDLAISAGALLIVSAVVFTPSVLAENSTSYSLSFESDEMQKFWPTPPNHYQQIDAVMWRDGDITSLSQLKNLRAEWAVDPDYVVIGSTDSNYFAKCIFQRTDLPCLRFAAHIQTRKIGRSSVDLKIYDANNQLLAWNSANLVIYKVDNPSLMPSSQPQSSIAPIASPSLAPSPSSNSEQLRQFEQKISYLEDKVNQQEQELKQTKNILERILNFLKRIFTRTLF